MDKPPLFLAEVNNGKMTLLNKEAFSTYLLSLEGKKVYVQLWPHMAKAKHSPSMRNIYWYYLRQIGRQTGEEPEALHIQLKRQFNVRSTANITTENFREYIRKIKQLMAEMGIELMEPEAKFE
jgi:hypothetical protein